MRLTSVDGSFIELEITGYQFPDGYEISGRWYYPDWLMIRGHVRDPKLQWKFSYACFYSSEARELGEWLRSIVDCEPVHKELTFTEPNVCVRLVERMADSSVLDFCLSQEFCPPDQPLEVRLGDGYPVEITVDHEQLRQAADAWIQDAAQFPDR